MNMQTHEPAPLSPEDRHKLTWEAATQRFLDVSTIHAHEWPSRAVNMRDRTMWRVYNTATGHHLQQALWMADALALGNGWAAVCS